MVHREVGRGLGDALALALSVTACQGERRAARQERPLHVEYAGCATVVEPRCLLEPGRRDLVFWTPLPEGSPLRVQVDGEAVPSSQAYVEGGVQLRIEIARGAREVSIESADGRRFTLALGERSTTGALSAAAEARARGALDEAERALRPALEDPDAAVRARARSLQARIAFSRGENERAVTQLERSAATLARLGDLAGAIADQQMAAMLLMHELWRFDAAERALDQASSLSRAVPEGRARTVYYRGRLAMQVADFVAALALLDEARIRASRLGLGVLAGHASQQRAIVLQRMGRPDEALSVLTEQREREAGCERADHLTALGWARLLARQDGATRVRAASPDPMPPLEAALAEYEGRCPRPHDLGNAHVNLALAQLLRGELDAARRHLEAAQTHLPEQSATVRAWSLAIEAQTQLAAGDPGAALVSWNELASRARAAADATMEWQALLGRALSLRALGRDDAALSTLREAEALVDEIVMRITLGDGRAAFAGEHERSARVLVELSVARGHVEEARTAARHARRRALRALQRRLRVGQLDPSARSRWSRTVEAYWALRRRVDEEASEAWKVPTSQAPELAARRDEQRAQLTRRLREALAILDADAAEMALAEPAEAEVVLTYFPGDEGWVGFATTAAGTMARAGLEPTPEAPAEVLAAQLLAPFADRIRAATRVRVSTYGWLEEIDLHELPFEGAPLGARRAVVYGVDLGAAGARSGGPWRALIVADPRRDLESAREEGRAVAALLAQRGRGVEVLVGDDVRPDRLARALRGADLFHYAGHGRFDGHGGWGSALPLAGESELSVGDVLMLPEVAREVVLSACEGGRSDDGDSGVLGLSLARAFIAAGSDAVIAAVRPIDDRSAAEMAAAYHGHRLSAGAPDPGEALRLARSELRERLPGHDWSSYRVFVP